MPEGEKPIIPPPPAIHIERTLVLVKPDAIHKSDEIEEIILQHGFTILQVGLIKCRFFLVQSPVNMKYILVRQQTEREFFCRGDEVVGLKKTSDLKYCQGNEISRTYSEYPFPWPLHRCVSLCFLNSLEFH